MLYSPSIGETAPLLLSRHNDPICSTVGQRVPAQANGTLVIGSPISTRKRHRGQDDSIETQAKRRKPIGSQVHPSRTPHTDAPSLTSKNLECFCHSQPLPFSNGTALEQWKFVNMPNYRRTDTKSRLTEDTSSSTKTVSTTDPRFQEIAANNGVLVPMDSIQPSNFGDIHTYLN